MFRGLMPAWLATTPPPPSSVGAKDSGDLGQHTAGGEDQTAGSDTNSSPGEITPKAGGTKVESEVPTFALTSNHDEDEGDEDEVQDAEQFSAPSYPAANSAQRASSMTAPPRPSVTSQGLMAPPARPSPALRTSPAASLRVPSSGPLPNRGPPAGSQQRVSSSLSPSGTLKTPNARGKVLLSPGHSPMDWAALTRSGNLSGVSTFQRVAPSQLKTMTGRKGKPAWSSWQGKVYNITPYLPFHPGGEAELMKAAGRDGTQLFMDVHPWVNWENMLGSCLVGVLVPEDYDKSELEDMD